MADDAAPDAEMQVDEAAAACAEKGESGTDSWDCAVVDEEERPLACQDKTLQL